MRYCANRIFLLVILALAVLPVRASGEEGEPSDAGYRELIEQLDSPMFGQRQAATDALKSAGAEAIPAMLEALPGASAEATLRMMRILQNHKSEGTPEAAEAATAALEKLASGDDSLAARARSILAPPADPSAPPQAPIPQPINRKLSVKRTNDKVEIELDVNGKKTRVRHDGKTFDVTHADPDQQLDDQPVKSYNSEEELKAADAQAHQVWKEHHAGPKFHHPGGGRIMMRGGGFAPPMWRQPGPQFQGPKFRGPMGPPPIPELPRIHIRVPAQ